MLERITSRAHFKRDTFTYALGFFGVIEETFVPPEPRLYLLFLFGGALGLPSVLGRDEKNAAAIAAKEADTPTLPAEVSKEDK